MTSLHVQVLILMALQFVIEFMNLNNYGFIWENSPSETCLMSLNGATGNLFIKGSLTTGSINTTSINTTSINTGSVTVGTNSTVNGFTSALGGSKIVVQNGEDGGSNQGIYMYESQDHNWGIYMATAIGGLSLNDVSACAGFDFNGFAIRNRVYEFK